VSWTVSAQGGSSDSDLRCRLVAQDGVTALGPELGDDLPAARAGLVSGQAAAVAAGTSVSVRCRLVSASPGAEVTAYVITALPLGAVTTE
jgi:hypothetical protein